MQETPDLIYHLEPPAAPGLFPSGPLVLQGWVHGKPGRHVVDLRARGDGGRWIRAVYGLPRADLAAHFRSPRRHLLAGFDLGLNLGDSRQVELEALDLSGEWLPLGVHPVVLPPNVAPPPAPPVIAAHDFFRALELMLRRAGAAGDLAAEARRIARELPHLQVVRFPHFPLRGHLHHPSLVALNQFGCMTVQGWLFHESRGIRRVLGSYDLLACQPLEHGAPAAYVSELYPQFPQAAHSGFRGLLDLPAQLRGQATLRIYAEMDDGGWELCHLQRSLAFDGEEAKAPLPRRPFFFHARAAGHLRKACREAGFEIPSDAAFAIAARASRSDYAGRSRRHRQAGPDEPAPVSVPPPMAPARAVLCTHNLNPEGAPLFLLELARRLAAQGTALTVLTAADGTLRADFAKLPARIVVAANPAALTARDGKAFHDEISRLGPVGDVAAADVVIANTLSGFWGIHLARAARKPSLLYLHESTIPDAFYRSVASAPLDLVDAAFAAATHISFLTEATRNYYRPWLRRGHHSINPGWVEIEHIDQFRATADRLELRRRLGVSSESRVVLNLGTVCERKGQHMFVRAIEQLWTDDPGLAQSCQFLIVGARATPFDRALEQLVRECGRPNVRLVAETSQVLDYYAAADVCVCSSYEESFPRVILEAMAFARPIVASSVHGIPEIVHPGREAELVPAGDTAALARTLGRLLHDPNHAAALGQRARDRVAELYDARRVLPRHVALVSRVARSVAS
ncbi:MAG TPA: glycosyltransferase family 4 protein [Candidatus Didemnitutus sp.]|jgi:glycosyltransferase involved in cell wall biosynthesis